MEEEKNLLKEDKESQNQELKEEPPEPSPKSAGGGGGGWGWGFSPLSVFSDLQKAAEEISRSAAEVAEKAAMSLIETTEDLEDSSKENETEVPATENDSEDEKNELRKSALDKLEQASEDSLLSQGLKVLDNSVENFAFGAWNAFGNAWKGGSDLVERLEHSAANLAETIQQGSLPASAGSAAPSLLETGRALTSKGMQVLEYVGKETIDLLIKETGIEIERSSEHSEEQAGKDQLYEEVTFDRCFYIYGGPEQLEELEALSSHYTLLFNRRKVKLTSDQKSMFDGKLKQIQQIFSLTEMNGDAVEADKGKKIETGNEGSDDEMKNLHDSSVSKAADMAAGFASALRGQNVNDMIQRTSGRLESLHSEGVHRLSEMCCFAVSHLLTLGKSVISYANKIEDEDAEGIKIEWPEDSIEKAKIIRSKAQSMAGYVVAVSNSFITGISDVAEAYQVAIKAAAAESQEVRSVQEKVNVFSEHIRTDQSMAVGKIQDGLQYLSYVVLSTSIPSA